jgi:hypothetical protein
VVEVGVELTVGEVPVVVDVDPPAAAAAASCCMIESGPPLGGVVGAGALGGALAVIPDAVVPAIGRVPLGGELVGPGSDESGAGAAEVPLDVEPGVAADVLGAVAAIEALATAPPPPPPPPQPPRMRAESVANAALE